MKNVISIKKAAAFFLAMITVCIAAVCLFGCAEKPEGENFPPQGTLTQSLKQDIDCTENTDMTSNPDLGFYRPIYVKISDSGVSYNKNVVTDATRLYHLRIDISAFSEAVNGSGDKPLTDRALGGLSELLSLLKQNDKNAIVRFAYDPSFSGRKNTEPSLATIKTHIEQVCSVLNNFETTVTAIEAGLIGPWGEMHTSTIATAEHISPIIDTFLKNTSNLHILVRTPKMLYDFLDITLKDIDGYKIEKTDKAYRVGIYNDGFMGSDSDLGTYTDRKKEVAFLGSQVTDYLPYGGEAVAPESKLHDIENCLPEMSEIHLNYLNVEWNSAIINKWKNTYYSSACGSDENYYGKTAFSYIENHLGYRFLLDESVFSFTEKFDRLDIKLSLKNVGFGNLTKPKLAQIVFTDESGEPADIVQVEDFTGELSTSYSVGLNLQNGKYRVFLCLYGEQIGNKKLYCLRLANNGIWNDSICGNAIGEITVQK